MLTVLIVSVIVLAYVLVGYPLTLRLLVAVRGARQVRQGDITPPLSFVISAYNEADVIRAKLENTLALDYPAGRREIVVISDCSNDGTDEIVQEFAGRGVILARQAERRGKTAGLNHTIPWLTVIEMLAGVIPSGGGSQRLLRTLGTARALEHILEGVPLSAAEALERGLVHRLVPEQQLLPETQATAARLARRSPTAVAALKRCLYFGTDRGFARSLSLEQAGFLAAGSTPGAARALTPFLEDLERLHDTPFLADPVPWIEGTRFDLLD